MTYDFDTIVNRKHTDCLKYDAAVRRHRPADILPFWVADMDIPTAPAIIEALQRRVAEGIFGYSEADPDRYCAVLDNWFSTRHHWHIQKDWLLQTPGVVFALAMAVKAYTKPGDAVLIQQPVYYPFSEVILDNGRTRISNDLVLKDGRYEIDFADLEEKIITHKVKLFLLCSPHNPVGRVWTKEELTRIGDICRKHNVIVVADEIHEDFAWTGHTHIPYASLGEDYAQQAIVCTSPSKSFNIAGLQLSNIFIPNETLRQQFKKEIDKAGYSQLNTLGLTASEAAYRDGADWLDALKVYLEKNIAFTASFVQKQLPELSLIQPEGTYLLWLDFRRLGWDEAKREDFLLHQAKLWLDSGAIFGTAGEGFERINIACPRATLQQGLQQLERALHA